MNNVARLHGPFPGLRPTARLSATLFLSVTLHAALVFGLGFTFAKQPRPSPTLEITLSTFNSEDRPQEADFLAQGNQQGSGSLEKQATPTTTEQAPFQDTEIHKIGVPATPPPPRLNAQTAKATVTTHAQRNHKAAERHKENNATPMTPPPTSFDREQLSQQIASLEAELANDVQRYAKLPKVHRLNAASTMRDKGAWYKDEWRKKIERIGNLNYPDEARRQQIHGSLRLRVTIKRDGHLQEVQILESSGQQVLDQAAMRIVRLAAPFAPLTGDLADFDLLEITRTWRFERGDRLSSQ
jgi:protein TonB